MLRYTTALLVTLSLMLPACYYRVTDPVSGRDYYTDNIKRYDQSGAISFKDKRTGQHVTLSSSEYEQISSDEYKDQIASIDEE